MVQVVPHSTSENTAPAIGPIAQRWTELVEHISAHGRLLRRGLGERIARHRLTDSQFSVLWACLKAPQGGIAQTELASELGLSPAHVSGQVETLRDRGLLKCERGPRDRRRQLWQLTSEGQTLLQHVVGEFDLHPTATAMLVEDPRWQDLLQLVSALASSAESNTDPAPSPACSADCTDLHARPAQKGAAA